MNNDLISRSALIQHAYSAVVDGVEKDIIDLSDVDNAPTVPYITKEKLSVAYDQGFEDGQKRPQGEWIAIEPYNHKTFCPFCKKDTRDMNYDNFCSNCGAKLKGGAE